MRQLTVVLRCCLVKQPESKEQVYAGKWSRITSLLSLQCGVLPIAVGCHRVNIVITSSWRKWHFNDASLRQSYFDNFKQFSFALVPNDWLLELDITCDFPSRVCNVKSLFEITRFFRNSCFSSAGVGFGFCQISREKRRLRQASARAAQKRPFIFQGPRCCFSTELLVALESISRMLHSRTLCKLPLLRHNPMFLKGTIGMATSYCRCHSRTGGRFGYEWARAFELFRTRSILRFHA